MTLRPETLWRFPLPAVNAYLLDDGDLTLVDAGMPMDASRIHGYVDATGHSLADVDRVLLTHYDFDHVGGLASLSTLGLDAPVYVADPDAEYLTGEARPPVGNRKGLFQRVVGLLLTKPDLPVTRVEDGDTIGSFTAFRTPGHTPGHTSYVHEDYRVAFLGDMVRTEGGALHPSPRRFTYDVERNRRSIREFTERVPPFDVGVVGHGDPLLERGREKLRTLEANL